MKVLVSLLAFAVAIDATCIFCDNNSVDVQEISYDDLISTEDFDQHNKDNANNVHEKFEIIQTLGEKNQLYTEEAQRNTKLNDPTYLVDATESLANGDIAYKNAMVRGLKNTILKEVDLDRINKNWFSVHAVLDKAEVVGDYDAVNSNERGFGQFQITLRNVVLVAKLRWDEFMQIQPKVDVESITVGSHESSYTSGEVLKGMDTTNAKHPTPYAFYYRYLNQVIKNRLANEMTIGLTPLIAKRLQQTFRKTVLFPENVMAVPKSVVTVTPGIQVNLYNVQLLDILNTIKIQKLANYTINSAGTEMLFSFTSYDLKGTTDWALKYNNGNTYNGQATFAIDNMQTIIVATKPSRQEKTSIKFVKTTINRLTILQKADKYCESIRNFVRQRIPEALKHNLETFISQQSEAVMKNQIALISEQNQY